MLLSFRDEISALISGVGKACVSFVKHCICTEPIIICDFFTQDFTNLLQPVLNVAVTLIFPDV
jgi:hypothetical protein